jgi:hypothetical protein
MPNVEVRSQKCGEVLGEFEEVGSCLNISHCNVAELRKVESFDQSKPLPSLILVVGKSTNGSEDSADGTSNAEI